MTKKLRLDAYLVSAGLCDSREKAKAEIMSGLVFINRQKALKASDTVKETDNIEVRGRMEFVSRGGYKLKKAISVFSLNLNEKLCIDIGASTGGFTDCMLQNGADKVYCVDVGYGQLAWKLRNDKRVINIERTNIRYVTDEIIPEKADFVAVDLSFISLCLVLPKIYEFLACQGECVCLIKPQFEAGREKVGKKGVVKEKDTHIEVIEKIISFAVSLGFTVKGLDFSPIKGPKGNIEYLLYLSKRKRVDFEVDVLTVVEASHRELDKKF